MIRTVTLSALALILTVSLGGAALGSVAIPPADWDVTFQAALPPDSLAAVTVIPDTLATAADSTKVNKNFRLLEADSYALDMHYSADMERLIVGLKFSLPKATIDSTRTWGMFIHRSAVITSVSVSGEYEDQRNWIHLLATDFDPLLAIPGLLAKDSPVRFFSLTLQNYAAYADTVEFEIWYTLPTPPFAENEQSVLSTGFPASQFWYPRRLDGPSTLNVKLTTAPDISLLLGGSYARHDNGRNFWQHDIVIAENPERPVSLLLIKDKQLN